MYCMLLFFCVLCTESQSHQLFKINYNILSDLNRCEKNLIYLDDFFDFGIVVRSLNRVVALYL